IMKKGLRKIICAVVALCAALPCAISPVFANSGHRYEYGVSGAGVLTPNENSVLAVESEKLTFNIPDFPRYGNSLSNYKSTVTAEYEFVNTGDSAVVTSMAFPIGVNPNYYGDLREPEIKVDGAAVEVQTRHTMGSYRYFADSVKYIYDDYYSDDFYTPDMEVTHYELTVEVPSSGYFLKGNVECGDGARFITWLGTEDEIDKYLDKGTNVLDFYVVGDTENFNCVWEFKKWQKHMFSGGEYVQTDRTFPIREVVESTTLKELILSYRSKDSVVSEMDWYNAFVSGYGNRKYISECDLATHTDYYFLAWYTYDVQVEPNGRFTNTVTVPLLPSVNDDFRPAVYNYEYYLSPAQSWQSFGTLEIEINTDYYLTAHSVPFKEKKGGYSVRLEKLPEGELEFALCSEAVPRYAGDSLSAEGFTVLLVILIIAEIATLAPVIIAIVYLIKSRKKR
ncbi:MAG: hypothetical protein K2K04_05720, partial [Clostridia bacterium]|nr:hypothetical protein [Clostridia bacterium]